jgi:type IV secretory pathway VirJ component
VRLSISFAGWMACCAAVAAAANSAAQHDKPAAEHGKPAASEQPLPPGETVAYQRFGDVTLYRPKGEIRDVVLFFSGDGGWDLGVVHMAQLLADKGALVAGINIRHYMTEMENAKEKCISPTVDLENFSHYLQSKLGLKQYLQPTLVGYSSGATLVYATLVEAPDNLFKGALSIGFCPDLDLRKPLCKGEGLQFTPRHDAKGIMNGVDYLAANKLSGRWISLQGAIDEVCPAAATVKFISRVPGGKVIVLPKVGHGYSVEKNWVSQFEAAYETVVAPVAAAKPKLLPAEVADLPLTEVPAAADKSSDWFAVFLSGDGGWVGLDRGVSEALARRGIPVVGWDSLKYFWSPRTPEGASADLDRVLRHYYQAYRKSRALVIGYSQGADTVPFMVNRLPAQTHALVGLTALLGLSDSAFFEFHVTHWLGSPSGGLPTKPEMDHWTGAPYLCIYGEDDDDSFCQQLDGKNGSSLKMPGGHHFGGGYDVVAAQIIQSLH